MEHGEYRVWTGAEPDFAHRVEQARSLLGAPDNPALLPHQFVAASLIHIGGTLVTRPRTDAPEDAAVVLPTRDPSAALSVRHDAHRPGATRLTLVDSNRPWAPDGTPLNLPAEWEAPEPVSTAEAITIGKPGSEHAEQARQLQGRIWQSPPDNLYPTWLYAPACPSSMSLVALHGDRVVGFLLGFQSRPDRDGTTVLESQVMGVDPDYRNRGIAVQLKQRQATMARTLGIDAIRWTADPLQAGSALLNFGRLGAFSRRFLPDYLPFRNELNRLPASRLRVEWALAGEDSGNALSQRRLRQRETVVPATTCPVANDGPTDLNIAPGSVSLHEGRAYLLMAIEIPRDWTALQQSDLTAARAWRTGLDDLLLRCLGDGPDQYRITNAVIHEGRVYLLAEQATDALLRLYR